jgi:hypothetical protein
MTNNSIIIGHYLPIGLPMSAWQPHATSKQINKIRNVIMCQYFYVLINYRFSLLAN